MVSTVDIPEHVTAVAWRAFDATHTQTGDLPTALADALTAAAPLLIATVRRQMAGELLKRVENGEWSQSDETIRILVTYLAVRANRLDPKGDES